MHDRDLQVRLNDKDLQISFIEGSKGERHKMLQRKLIERDHISDLGEFCRRQGIRVSFVTGAYDMIHIGHVRYLYLARSLGDILVVGLNSDTSVKLYKGPDRPILEEMKRAEMLSFLTPVDFITIYPEKTGAEVIRLLKPDAYLCVEGSWEGDISTKEEIQAMTESGGDMFYSPRQDPHLSTSAIINKIERQRSEKLLEAFQRIVLEGTQ